jgi:flagellar biogenesis protein FliO
MLYSFKMFSIITLPDTFLGSTTAYITDLFSDLWIIIALVIGLPLGFWVIRKIMAIMPK